MVHEDTMVSEWSQEYGVFFTLDRRSGEISVSHDCELYEEYEIQLEKGRRIPIELRLFLTIASDMKLSPRAEKAKDGESPYTSSFKFGSGPRDEVKVYFDAFDMKDAEKRLHNANCVRALQRAYDSEETMKRLDEKMSAAVVNEFDKEKE